MKYSDLKLLPAFDDNVETPLKGNTVEQQIVTFVGAVQSGTRLIKPRKNADVAQYVREIRVCCVQFAPFRLTINGNPQTVIDVTHNNQLFEFPAGERRLSLNLNIAVTLTSALIPFNVSVQLTSEV